MIKEILDKQFEEENKIVEDASIISEVKLLVDNDSRDDVSLITSAFSGSINSNVLEVSEQKRRVKKLADEYKGEVFTHSQIRDLCLKYKLRFLPSIYYKGTVPVEAIHKLKELIKSNDKLKFLLGSSERVMEGNIFMVAPGKMFNLKNGWQAKSEAIKEARRLKNEDPALFIKLEDGNYLFVKEWGNSFSPLRQLLAIPTKTVKRLNIINVVLWSCFVLLMVYFSIMCWSTLFVDDQGWRLFRSITIGLAVSAATIVFSISWVLPASDGFFLARFKDQSDAFSVDENLASEKNWNTREKV